jgi:hypothetical protein
MAARVAATACRIWASGSGLGLQAASTEIAIIVPARNKIVLCFIVGIILVLSNVTDCNSVKLGGKIHVAISCQQFH